MTLSWSLLNVRAFFRAVLNFWSVLQVRENLSAWKFLNFIFWKSLVQKCCFSKIFARNCAKISTEFLCARKFVREKISTNKVQLNIQTSIYLTESFSVDHPMKSTDKNCSVRVQLLRGGPHEVGVCQNPRDDLRKKYRVHLHFKLRRTFIHGVYQRVLVF